MNDIELMKRLASAVERYGDVDSDLVEAFVEVAERTTKYYAHNLERNPGDLPEVDRIVLFATAKGDDDDCEEWHVGGFYGYDGGWADMEWNVFLDVIAWREIRWLADDE